MTIAFYCRASGRHIGLDELKGVTPNSLDRWKVHKMYCPFCHSFSNELSDGIKEQSIAYEYG